MKLNEIAAEIGKYLTDFEKNHNPIINGFRRYYHANVHSTGKCVAIQYVGYQLCSNLSKDTALAYLEWLQAGNIGKHYDFEKTLEAVK
jgi:hypothetical protein